jgi:hypothetical protein
VGTPMRMPVSDGDREQAAALLQRACGDGRLTLEEFSARVGAVWAAENHDELVTATSGLVTTPIVGSAQSVDEVTTVFSSTVKRGRWRLRSPILRTRTVFGSVELDLREALTDQRVIEIAGSCVFGELTVIVPEGFEVDLVGRTVFASKDMKLAPVPRVPGTPEVRITVDAWFSSVTVKSRPYSLRGR